MHRERERCRAGERIGRGRSAMGGLWWHRSLRPRYFTLGTAALAAMSAGLLVSKSDVSMDGALEVGVVAGQGVVRSSRAIYVFAANSLDYKYSLQLYDNKSEEYFEARSQAHLRAAERILKLCKANRGFYIKAGQFLASLQHMPKEYVATLSVLQDQAQPCSFKIINRLLMEEFGTHMHDMFKEFDERPIAAASLAQVHRAILKDGREVAVKVQYPRLHQQFKIDISTMTVLSKVVGWLFSDYQFEWIVPEFKKTLLRELDFEQEAKNAERTAKNFQQNVTVKIPQVFWDMTTKRILTMQFMRGCKVDDIECLEKAGIDPLKVARILVEVFAEMIFSHGFVHGDPHPGNILIQQHADQKGGPFSLVLLDHGLYRELDEGFRSDFCQLWKALILLDPIEMRRAGESLGAGKHYKYLPVIFIGRTLDSTSGLGKGMSAEERKKLREEVRRFTMGDISQFLEGLSLDFLSILRIDGLLRSITSKLGAEPRMRLMVNAKYAVTGLALQQKKWHEHQWQKWICSAKAQLGYVNLLLRLQILELNFKLRELYGSFLRILHSIQNVLEMHISSIYSYLLP